LFLFAVSLLAILTLGYHVGTFDQAIHIPFLKKYVDNTLFPNDPFFDLRYQHFSYFWFFFQPLYWLDLQLHPLVQQPYLLWWGMFAAHVLATYLTFWAVWKLADLLFKNPLTNVLAVLAFIVPHLGFAGFPVIEFSLLNRTFVLPFLLWAIIFFLRRRYLLSFALMGLMYNLHVISVNFALAMILFACMVEFRRVGWRNILAGMTVFVVCALPVLIWKGKSSPIDLTPDFVWFDIISRGTLYNLFFMIAPYFHILVITACGLGALALFFVARWRRPSSGYHYTVTLFIVAVIIILVVEAVTAQWLPLRIIVQSQIIRAGLFALIFGYLYFANYIVTRWEAGELSRFDGVMLAGTFIASPLSFVPLIILGFQRLIKSASATKILSGLTVLVTAVATLVVGLSYNLFGPGIYIYPHETPWYQAQLWAKDNTPKDTWFITPPEIWSFYDSEWRVFSERSTVATHSELLEAAFAPHYVSYWLARFNDLAPGAFDKFRGNFFDNQKITAQAFYQLSTADFQRLAVKYNASYLVLEKPNRRDLPVCYGGTDAENPSYIIYALTPQAAAAANCKP
jgi:hypothetical protein